MSVEKTRDRFDSTLISVVVTTLVFWTVLNWPYQYMPTAFQFWQVPSQIEYSFSTFAFPNYEIMQGGFPFTYYSREADDATADPKFWSPISLSVNVLMGLIATLTAGWLTVKVRRRLRGAKLTVVFNQLPAARRYGLMIAVIVVLGLLAAAIGNNDVADRRLAKILASNGAVCRYTLVPSQLARVFPASILGKFARVRSVMLWSGPPERISQAVKIPTLTTFSVIGRRPTTDDMQSLANNDQLKSLLLRGVKIDDTLKQSVLNLTTLRQLELIQCEGLDSGIAGIENLTRLQVISFADSDIRLSSLPETDWPKNIRRMQLSRPRHGSDSLRLRSIASLESLSVSRSDDSLNAEIVKIELADLPALTHFGIETLQKFSLDIESVPRLGSIAYVDPEIMLRLRSRDTAPVAMWFSSLRVRDLPSLRDLVLDGVDLEELSLTGVPNLTSLSIGRYAYQQGISKRPFDESKKPQLQRLINSLGDCDGPVTLDLSSLPLGEIDLDPLVNNHRIRNLGLNDCGIHGSQLPILAKLSRLTSLDLRSCPITDEEANGLLRQGLPLTDMLVSSDKFERIEVLHQASLRGFIATDSLHAKTVHIVDSPQLEAELVLGRQVEQLTIRDGHSLLGLSVDGPLPADAELHGLRSLRFFAIGGPSVDDELCHNLWQCTELDHLTIAYGRLSRSALQNVGRLSRLIVLSLPGSEIDDDLVIRNWTSLQNLSDVDISDTAISTATVNFLLSRKNLQKLSLNHCQLTKADLRGLSDVTQLIELEVAGIGLHSDTLVGCLRRGMVDRLDLSESELTDRDIETLAGHGGSSLVFLGLRGCQLSDDSLRKIANAHPRLALDVTDNPISPELLAELQSQNRLLDQHDHDGFLRLLSEGESYNLSDLRAEFDPVRGRIDSFQFVSPKPPGVGI